MRNILVIAVLILVSGCVATAPLVPVTYDKPAEISTNQTATIKLDTGIITGASGSMLMSAGNNVYAPISTGPIAALHFGEDDQLTFLRSLSSELTRMGILNILESGKEIDLVSDHEIRVIFLRTHHDPNSQVYTLDVALEIKGKQKSFTNRYHIVSHTSMKEKWLTNAAQGKEKAAKKLIAALIEDIQKYLAELSASKGTKDRLV